MGIDPVLQKVSTLLGDLKYDYLVIATGSKTNLFGNEQIKKIAWLAWLLVHVFHLLGGRSKLVVLANWAYQFFTYQSGTRVIINPYVRPGDRVGREFTRRPEMDS